MTPPTPRTLHLMVRERGGGTETNVHRLCDSVPEFHARSLEKLVGHPPAWWRWPSALRAIRAFRAEVVFCYGLRAHLAAMAAYPFGGPPLVGSVRGLVDFGGNKGRVQRLVAWRFARWVSNSRAALRGREGIVIVNGVDEPPAEQPLFRDLPRPVFGMLANGNPDKGHDFFLETWAALGKPGSVVFAGDLGPELKSRAEAAGAICPGYVQSGPALRSFDMLVVPSRAEGMPTVLLEAMIRGVPCLATPVGGIPELVEHRQTGYLLARPEWRAFLASVDWDEARAIAGRARDRVRREFSFEQMRERFIAVARDVARK